MPENDPTTEIARRVDAGAAWLDAHYPDWLDRIDLDRLDLESCLRCVLGQVAGDFLTAVDAWLGSDVFRARNLGFSGATIAEYAALTAEWRGVIERRRAVRDRVAGGVAWLDALFPGWVDRIDPDQLRMQSCISCVLGQVAGDFYVALGRWLDGSQLLASALGFTLPPSPDNGVEHWGALTAEWRRVIEQRQAVSA